MVVVSLLLAPNRGLAWRWARDRRSRRRLGVSEVLADLYALSGQHGGEVHGHPVAVLRAMASGRFDLERSLEQLRERGWARGREGEWALTGEGRGEAERRFGHIPMGEAGR